MPYALLGYATDYANGVPDEPTPVEELDPAGRGEHRDVRADARRRRRRTSPRPTRSRWAPISPGTDPVAAVVVAAPRRAARPGARRAASAPAGARALRDGAGRPRAALGARRVAPDVAFEAHDDGRRGRCPRTTTTGPVLLAAPDVPGLDAAVARDGARRPRRRLRPRARRRARRTALPRRPARASTRSSWSSPRAVRRRPARRDGRPRPHPGDAAGRAPADVAADARALGLDPVAPADLRALVGAV